MKKEERVINYYLICNRLKDVIRTGWLYWQVKKERLESVAEHVFGVQMLALAIKSEYQYDIDIMKVIYMLAIHEVGETIIGDLTPNDMTVEDKEKIEHEAVHSILKDLIDGEEIEKLFLEFDSHSTKEAMFAFECDKLECDIQCKIYDELHCVDINHQENNPVISNELVKKIMEENSSWSTMWIKHDQIKQPFDENFQAITNYLIDNEILKKDEDN